MSVFVSDNNKIHEGQSCGRQEIETKVVSEDKLCCHSRPSDFFQTFFDCDVCNCCFMHKNDFDSHHHRIKEPVSCNICCCKFDTCCLLEQHQRHCSVKYKMMTNAVIDTQKHNLPCVPAEDFRCNTCSEIFIAKSDFDWHMQRKRLPFSCGICCKIFTSSDHLALHKKRHERSVSDEAPEQLDQRYIKQMATEEFNNEAVYSYRRASRDSSTLFRCNVCTNTFVSKLNLDSHHHLKLKQLACNTCSQLFASCFLLEQHKQSCNKTPKMLKEIAAAVTQPKNSKGCEFRCFECNDVFDNKENLDLHNRFCNGSTVSNTCTTDKSDNELSQYGTKLEKMGTIISEVGQRDNPAFVPECEFKCSDCCRTFISKNDLDFHLQLKNKPFFCEICCMVFAHPLHLEEHRNKHAHGTSDGTSEMLNHLGKQGPLVDL